MTVLTGQASPLKPFLAGVVEGFYGRPWPQQARLRYARLLPSMGLNSYLYCPKADPYLRRAWQQHWPEAEWRELHALASGYRDAGLYFGLGLSPFALYQHYGAAERVALKAKVEQLRSLEAPLLALLFDDMPGDVPDLAERQAEIVADVGHWAPDLRLLMCPTYYSFDPVLERYFGAMPEAYWARLGALLPPAVEIFWTGNAVCSERICRADLKRIRAALGRGDLVLWDNYPVNDGAVRSKRLYLEPLPGREPALKPLLSGHFCNPMNQPQLSLPGLRGLAMLYGLAGFERDWDARHLGRDCWHLLQRDAARFREGGLDALSSTGRDSLAAEYAACPGLAAEEVAAWLGGEYAFDPACLTD